MKEIFKSWRRYESTLSEGVFGGAAKRDRDWQKLASEDPDEALRQRRIEKEKANEVMLAALKETWITLGMLADPTGVTGYPELGRASKLVYNEPTVMHAGSFFLALLGALPGISAGTGGARIFGRTVRAGKVLDNAGDVSRTLRRVGQQGAQLADEVDDAAALARRRLRDVAPDAAGGVAPAARAVPAIAAVGGRAPAVNKIGKRSGVFVDVDGRSVVTVSTDTGPVSFMYSSGTSMQSVDAAGRVVASPRVWMPVGAEVFEQGEKYGRYQKYGPPRGVGINDIGDARFGTGNKEIWKNLLEPIPKDWSDWMSARHGGHDWGSRIWTDPKVTADVEFMINQKVFTRMTDSSKYRIAKYASPNSEFGRIAADIEKLSPNGAPTDKLIDAFGPVHRDAGPGAYNAWRSGDYYVGSPAMLREHLDVFRRWRKIIL